MNHQLLLVLSLLGMCVAMFVINRPRADVVALLMLVALALCGVVTVPEALAGFSDPNVILIAAFFVVGDGLVRTGIANRIGDFLLRHAAGNETRLIVFLMLSVSVLGSIMSSTGVVALFVPIVLTISERQRLHPGKLMMPLSFAGLISGMLTLVATAPNLVSDSALKREGYEGFRFFTFTPFGVAILIAGIFYILFARRWLGGEVSPEQSETRRRSFDDIVRDYDLSHRKRRLQIEWNSPLVDQTIADWAPRKKFAANIVAVERFKNGRPMVWEPRFDFQFAAGDVLLVDFTSAPDEAVQQRLAGAHLQQLPLEASYFTDQSRELGMAEVMLPPESGLIGRTVTETTFRRKFTLNVIGIRRGGKAIETDLSSERLRTGDVLLVIGRWKRIHDLQTRTHDFVVLNLPAEVDQVVPAARRAPHALVCLAIMVTLMVFGRVPNVMAALLGCLLMFFTRCVTLDSAYKSIQWPLLMLIVGMMPFSAALEKTGGVDLAARGLVSVFGKSEPRVLLAALFSLTAVIGMFVSNTATAVLMAPIAVTVAQALGVSPHPFVMTVALAASAAFMTPVSSPVNTLVLVPGRYKFGDFLKVGVPFTIITLLIVVFLVPWLLPLKP